MKGINVNDTVLSPIISFIVPEPTTCLCEKVSVVLSNLPPPPKERDCCLLNLSVTLVVVAVSIPAQFHTQLPN